MLKQLGRVCLAGIFINGGSGALRKPEGPKGKVEKAGLPQPEFGVRVNGATMTIGGAALALGIAPKVAAAALIASLIPTTLVGHPFWKEETPQGRAMQRTQFFKNLGLIGGLLWVLADSGEDGEKTEETDDESH